MSSRAIFRFYEELNDFLPRERQKCDFPYMFNGSPSVKDTIEAIGVPHTEVDLILVNGSSVDFDYNLSDCDRVSVYPMFESIDISPVNRLRPEPLRETGFVCDVHLGTLAKYLRVLGFDTKYENSLDDPELVDISTEEHRILLTRDIELLKHGRLTHAYWVRSKQPKEQFAEVIRRFDLTHSAEPFTRCSVCNGLVHEVPKDDIADELEPGTRENFHEFSRCENCGRIYWKGSHYRDMLELLAENDIDVSR